jgi:hypothetical protein
VEAPKSKHRVARSEESTITALAKEAHTPQDVVQHFYDQEVASLEAEATVKSFIGIIAGRRVRQRLKALSSIPH